MTIEKHKDPIVGLDELVEAGATQFLYKIAGYNSEVIEEKPKSALELAQLLLDELKAQEAKRLDELKTLNAKILALEEADKETKLRLKAVEDLVDANSDELERFSNGHGFWYSVIGFCAKHNLTHYSTQAVAALNRRAKAKCKKAGIRPQKLNDPTFGIVNSYPEHILLEVILN